MKKILAVILACLMLITILAACNNNDGGTPATTPTPTPSGGGGTETATTGGDEDDDPDSTQRPLDDRLFGWVSNWHNYGLPFDPITIDVVVDQGVMRHPGPLNNLSDFMLQNATGITLNFIGADEERFGVMIATGDLPEIVTNIASRPEVWADVINSGQIMDMTDLYNRFGDNLKTIYDGIPIGWINYWVDEWTDSSGLYFLTQGIRNLGDVKLLNVQTGASGGLFVQNDIYYEIGMPPITGADGRFSEDAFIDVLVQMQDYARNVRGLSNAWGYSGINWGANMFYVEFPYQFGVKGFNTASYVNDQTNEYLPMFSDTSHPRWDGYRFFNRMHLAGVVDPEMFIIPWDAYEDKLHAGEIMYTYFTWTNDYYNFDNELAGGYPIPGVPVLWDTFMENDYIGHGIGGVRAINAKSENAERIMAMFDYMVTDEYFVNSNKHPLEGVLWDYDENGNPQKLGEYLEAHTDIEVRTALFDRNTKYDFGQYGQMVGITEKITARGFPSNFELADYWLEDNVYISPALDLWFRIVNPGPHIKFQGQWAAEQIQQGRAVTNPPPEQRLMIQFAPGAPEEYAAIGTRIENLVADFASRLVFASSTDAFESILADLCAQIAAMGEQEVYEDAIARYEVSKQVAARIIAGN